MAVDTLEFVELIDGLPGRTVTGTVSRSANVVASRHCRTDVPSLIARRSPSRHSPRLPSYVNESKGSSSGSDQRRSLPLLPGELNDGVVHHGDTFAELFRPVTRATITSPLAGSTIRISLRPRNPVDSRRRPSAKALEPLRERAGSCGATAITSTVQFAGVVGSRAARGAGHRSTCRPSLRQGFPQPL